MAARGGLSADNKRCLSSWSVQDQRIVTRTAFVARATGILAVPMLLTEYCIGPLTGHCTGPLAAGATGSSNRGARYLRHCAASGRYRARRRQHRPRCEPQEFATSTLQISTVRATYLGSRFVAFCAYCRSAQTMLFVEERHSVATMSFAAFGNAAEVGCVGPSARLNLISASASARPRATRPSRS